MEGKQEKEKEKSIESFTNGNFIRRSGDFSAIAEVCAMTKKRLKNYMTFL